MKNHDYVKLRGRGFKKGSFFSLSGIRASLWLGQDHMLCIYNKGYEEDYKRFYYRDIQAIIVHQDNRRLVWNILFGVFALLFSFWGTPLLFVSLFFLLMIMINSLLGPTCTCFLQTAVSRETLSSLNRLRNVNFAITRLTHVIEHAQGQVSPEEIKQYYGEKEQSGPGESVENADDTATRSTTRSTEAGKRQSQNLYNGAVHTSLFFVLIISGMLTAIDFFHKSVPLTTFQMIWSSGLSVLLIIALVKQQGSALSAWTRRLTWTTLGFMCAVSFIGYFIVIFLTFQSKTAIYTTWDYMKMLSTVSPYDNSFLMVIYIVSIIYCVAAGIAGLACMSSYKIK